VRRPETDEGTTALVVAHPGHELHLHGWLERTRPWVFILTDGSGSAGTSRLESSRRVLEAARARPTPLFGVCSDRELYERILRRDVAFFRDLVDRLAESLLESGCRVVAGDAAEGYNTGHDLCRLLLDAAVARVRRTAAIDNLSCPVAGTAPKTPKTEETEEPAFRSWLDDAAFERKLLAARSYPEMHQEVDAALTQEGIESFRCECLYRVEGRTVLPGADEKPYYETFGERRVAEGRFREVVRYRQHIKPLEEALRDDAV